MTAAAGRPVEDDDRLIRRVLLVSIASTAAVGTLGVVLGVVSGSSIIVLDAAFALVGIAVSWLLMHASKVSSQGPDRRFPYGRHAATPLAIAVQGVAMLATLLWALVDAVRSIREGGTQVATAVAFAYALVATVASAITWWWLRRFAPVAEVLTSEATAWRIAVLRGAGIVAGFALMGLLDGSRFDPVVPYLDPAMVVITCLVFIPAPLRMVHATITELMEAAPPTRVQQPALAAIEEVRLRMGLPEPTVRMTKVGSKLYVEVDVLVDPSVTVGEEDEVRRALRDRLERLPFEIWLNVELSADPTWSS